MSDYACDDRIQDPVCVRKFPKGCVIEDIRRGGGVREQFIYAKLVSPSGELLIAATLEYIYEQLEDAEFV